MRKLFATGIAALFLASTALTLGCDSGTKAKVPEKTMDVPKEGPKPAGGGGGAPTGGTGGNKASQAVQ